MSDAPAGRVIPSPARVLPLREAVGFPETVLPGALHVGVVEMALEPSGRAGQ